ncbi:alpha/beta hydrolase [Microbacterium pseudoresistens]|uniref:Acetyl esterase n=1 Tax=Microbacterium pseudoresistens TaxID=640634 RepID=A0A7Y9EU13_9MICO|nr:alpha/beta hydrolase [Microbacterium pseudoresistens]NYD53940.1 acetyl esterase [Microbacterium pseudoresistens]
MRPILDQPALEPAQRAAVYAVEDRLIDVGSPLPVRIYEPSANAPLPILMYFHGGAFFSGTLESHDEIARALCAAAGFKVVSVGYRLAPEHPFPTPLLDCYEATAWVTSHEHELGWDGLTLAVCGDSSGGNLAAAVSQLARERRDFVVSAQVLFYPGLDLASAASEYPSRQENAVGYGLETAQLPDFYSFYLSRGADPADPLVSPLKEDWLESLPPTLVITAEYDPLRDEGETYGLKLKEAGVPAEIFRYEGATHGFLGKFTHLPEFEDVYRRAADFLAGQRS